MDILPNDCCVLNSGNGAWAFEPLAVQLSSSLGIDLAGEPRRFNYLLNLESGAPSPQGVFIPTESVRLAADKRLLASIFREHGVPTPETHLLDTFEEVIQFVLEHPDCEWCIKYPTSCGASGHRIINASATEPRNWPRPFVLQEFIRLEHPEVYRTYCAAGETFGWLVRRFPDGSVPTPWVAHARGARYQRLGMAPTEARKAAESALIATGLSDSFGCVDLLRKPAGEWLVLEVGTDGLFNYVDRDLGDENFERELDERIADAFWKSAQRYGDECR